LLKVLSHRECILEYRQRDTESYLFNHSKADYILHGSVATHLRCDGIFSGHLTANFLQRMSVKESWK